MWKRKDKIDEKATIAGNNNQTITPPQPPAPSRFDQWAQLPGFEHSYHLLEALESIAGELAKLNETMLRIESNTR